MHAYRHILIHGCLILGATILNLGCETSSSGGCDATNCAPGPECEPEHCPPTNQATVEGELGRFLSASASPVDYVIFASYDANDEGLVIGTRSETGEVFTRSLRAERSADTASPFGQWTQVAHDQQQAAHIAWHDQGRGTLQYSRLEGSLRTAMWTQEDIDGSQSQVRGTHLTMTLDSEGAPHLAYRDETAKTLRYAYQSDEGWRTELVPGCQDDTDCGAGGDYGEYASIVVIAGVPRIAFYDRREGDLKLAQRDAENTWRITTLDGRDPTTGTDTGDVGRFATMATDSKRRLGIAYFDATNGALRYLFASTGQTAPIEVDAGRYGAVQSGTERRHVVGQHVSLAFDAQDNAVMVYLDATQLALKASWVQGNQVIATRTLSSTDPGAWYTLIPLDEGGFMGAYGGWALGDRPRHRLAWFELPKEAP